MVLSAADRFGDAEAIVDGPLRLTFNELVDRVRRAAGAFSASGIDKGDRIAIWAPNSAQWIIAAFGAVTAGAALVPVNTRFKAEEAADIIRRSGAKAVLIEKGFLGQDFAVAADVPAIDIKSGFLDEGEPFERQVSGEDIADIIYTSGWLHTGDLGSFTEAGRLRIVGRKKDMFIVGGFNAYPAEIEGYLMEHPAVGQAAVIGVPDDRLGQVGKAFVVPKGGKDRVSGEELIAWSRDRMAGFKVPRFVEFLEELPLNATGKVMKDRLVERHG
jgi:acyl-CoA synthetase (AMP-forming)/AMP-acid ligase II